MSEDFHPSDDEPGQNVIGEDGEELCFQEPALSKLPLHVPIYPPPWGPFEPLPTLFAEQISDDVYTDIINRMRQVGNFSRLVDPIYNVVLFVSIIVSFVFVVFLTESLVLPMLLIVLIPLIFSVSVVGTNILIRILNESYFKKVSRVAAQLAAEHNLTATGARLAVRSFAGAYRQPWQLYHMRYPSNFKVALVVDLPGLHEVYPTEYSFGMRSRVILPGHSWEAERPACLEDSVNSTDWERALETVNRASVDCHRFDTVFYLGVAIAVVLLFIPCGLFVLYLESTGSTGGAPVLVGVLFILMMLCAMIMPGFFLRIVVVRAEIRLATRMRDACQRINAALTDDVQYQFGWKTDALGFFHRSITSPTITVIANGGKVETEESMPQGGLLAPLQAYPVMLAGTTEEANAGLLQRAGREHEDYV